VREARVVCWVCRAVCWKIIKVSLRSLWDRIQGVEEGIHGSDYLAFLVHIYSMAMNRLMVECTQRQMQIEETDISACSAWIRLFANVNIFLPLRMSWA
jgi:hypothetical protein